MSVISKIVKKGNSLEENRNNLLGKKGRRERDCEIKCLAVVDSL